MAAADLDCDGDIDVATANANGDEIAVFLQISTNVFTSQPLVLGGPGITDEPGFVVAADLDGDGDGDIASANRSGNDLTVFFQTSKGSFALQPLTLGGAQVTDGPNCLAARDLDGDNDLDLVSANASGSTLTVFFQTANGNFAQPPLVLGGPAVVQGPLSVVAADLDSDGDLDLACATPNDFALAVFFQEAPGQFTARPELFGYPLIIGPHSVDAADFDGDGAVDLACISRFPSTPLALFLQVAPGKFVGQSLDSLTGWVAEHPGLLTAADFDGDGDPDLAFANSEVPTIVLCLGGR